MAESKLTPLQYNVAIVNSDGTPTPYFIQLLQQLYEEKKITDELAEGAAQKTLQIIAGAGLDGGGNLSADITIDADVQEILDLISTTRGTILYRGAALWSALAPGTAGHFLKTNGAGADPEWAAGGGGGSDWTEIKLTSDFVTGLATFSLITDGSHPFSWVPPANSDIEIEIESMMQTVATANLPRLQVVVPGAANNTQYGYIWISESQTVSTFSYQVQGFGTGGGTADFTSGAFASSGGVFPGIGRVKVRTGSSPAAIVANAAAESAAANACTIKAGSRYRYRVLA